MLEDGQVEVKHSLTQKTPEKLLYFSGVFYHTNLINY